MNSSTDAANQAGKLEFLQVSTLGMDADALLADLTRYYTRMLGRRTIRTDTPFLYQALVHSTRDRLMERWNQTNIAIERSGARRACYLSMEFLMGRLLRNALLNLDLTEEAAAALESLGVKLEEVLEAERMRLAGGMRPKLARAIWDRLKDRYTPDFVSFVEEKCMPNDRST